MNAGDTAPDMLSLLSYSDTAYAPAGGLGDFANETVMNQQAQRAALREQALGKYLPPPPQNMTALLPLLQLFASMAPGQPGMPQGMPGQMPGMGGPQQMPGMQTPMGPAQAGVAPGSLAARGGMRPGIPDSQINEDQTLYGAGNGFPPQSLLG